MMQDISAWSMSAVAASMGRYGRGLQIMSGQACETLRAIVIVGAGPLYVEMVAPSG